MLRRCIESVVKQALPFEYEIIISDDNSSDGTWELALALAAEYGVIRVHRFNSDDYSPVSRSQRCAWNQGNAFHHSSGKYFIHVDADDYFIEGTEVLKKQVELLEQHPECSCCMANHYSLKDGEDMSKALLYDVGLFKTGQVLSADFYAARFFRIDHAFIYRRYPGKDPASLLGCNYDDTTITHYYIQFGDIVCLDEPGYVYVIYKDSISNEIRSNNDDVVLCGALVVPSVIPYWRKTIIRSWKRICELLKAVRLALAGHRLQDANLAYMQSLPFRPRLISFFNRDLSFIDKAYLKMLLFVLKVCKHTPFPPVHRLAGAMIF